MTDGCPAFDESVTVCGIGLKKIRQRDTVDKSREFLMIAVASARLAHVVREGRGGRG
jgi:hypothetical protein